MRYFEQSRLQSTLVVQGGKGAEAPGNAEGRGAVRELAATGAASFPTAERTAPRPFRDCSEASPSHQRLDVKFPFSSM